MAFIERAERWVSAILALTVLGIAPTLAQPPKPPTPAGPTVPAPETAPANGARDEWGDDWVPAKPRPGSRPITILFQHEDKAPPVTVPLMLVDRARAFETLRQLGPSRSWGNYIVRRDGVTDAMVEAALKEAQENVSLLFDQPAFPDGASQTERSRLTVRRNISRTMLWSILSAEGAAGQTLSRPFKESASALYEAHERLRAVAHGENLKGQLASGEVFARLKHEGPDASAWRIAAAGVLAQYGFNPVPAEVARVLTTGEAVTDVFAWACTAERHPEMLDAVRTGLAQRKKALAEKGYHFRYAGSASPEAAHVAYLIANGEDADLRTLETIPMGTGLALLLAQFVDDPRPLMPTVAREWWGPVTSLWLAARCHELDREGGDALETFLDLYIDVQAESAEKAKRAFNRANMRNTVGVLCSAFRADGRTADFFNDGKLDPSAGSDGSLLGMLPWIRAPHLASDLLRRTAAGYSFLRHMMALPTTDRLALADSPEFPAAFELPAVARAYLLHYVPCEDHYGAVAQSFTMRRPFLVRHREKDGIYGGAISGLLCVTPRLIDETLRLEIGLELAPVYKGGSLVDYKEGKASNYEHHRFVADYGRQLVHKITVRCAGKLIDLSPIRRERGLATVEAKLPTHDLAGLVAQVELRFFEQDMVFAFDLAASPLGRNMRRADDRVTIARSAVKERSNPERERALAELLVRAGRVTEGARMRVAQAIAARDSALGLAAVDALSDAGLHREAQKAWSALSSAGVATKDSAFDRASVAYKARDFKSAADAFEKIYLENKSDKEALYYASVATYLAGDQDGARRLLNCATWHIDRPVALALQWALAPSGPEADALAATMKSLAKEHETDQRLRHTVGALLDVPAYTRSVDQSSDGPLRARVACFAGLAQLRAGRAKQAAEQFLVAIESGDDSQVERLIAEVCVNSPGVSLPAVPK